MSELPILDARRANQQLGAAVAVRAWQAAAAVASAAARRAGIARRLGELPQAVLDRPIVGREGDERHVLIERARDVAQRVQALAALATQVAQALAARRSRSR